MSTAGGGDDVGAVSSAVSHAPKRLLAELRRSCKYARTHFDPEASLDQPIQITESIWIYADPDKVTSMKALILGPSETPYEQGFFLFNIDVPTNYPNVPPKVKLLTTDGTVHFNPNLYKNGKVCLSTLGTWSGPSWTCAMTISSTCIDIQSLLVPDPLTNEPSYGVRTPHQAHRYDTYNQIIEHATVRVAMWQMLHCTPAHCDVFVPLMQKLFAKHAPAILRRVDALQLKHPEKDTLHCDMWYNFSETIDYGHWTQALRGLYKTLSGVQVPLPAIQDDGAASGAAPDTIMDTNESKPAEGGLDGGGAGAGAVDSAADAMSTLQLTSSGVPNDTPSQNHTLPNTTTDTSTHPPPTTKRKYIRRPKKQDRDGKVCGDTIQISQKDGKVITFKLTAGKKDPQVLRWLQC
jgi:ubiquitin-protein ligase